MSATVSLRCPGCNARIKAPLALLGQRRACPGCKTSFLVRPRPPQDSNPVLVADVPPAPARR